MLAHTRQLLGDPAGFLLECATDVGDVVELPLPGRPVFVVSEPEAVLRVLRGNHPAYGKDTRQYAALAQVTGEGLLVADGETWREARRIVQPAFHRGALEPMVAETATAAESLARQWIRADGPVDVDAALMRVTLELVGRTLLGTDLADADAVVDAVVRALDGVVARARLPVPMAVPTPTNVRMRRAVAAIDETVAALVAARRGAAGSRGADDADVLGLLLASGLDDRQVRDQVVTLVVAGHETVAAALTWACWLLATHREVQERVAAESQRLLDPEGAPPSLADLETLAYTRAVLHETLRLYPPAWVLSRRALGDDVLAGVPVAAGSLVIVSPYALQRDPRGWTRPGSFDPERFTVDRPEGAYLPFGAGPRLCVGRELALAQGVVLLAGLVGRCMLEPLPGKDVRLDARVTLRPRGGLPLRVAARSPGSD
jgi:cytochrome P450